MNILYIGDIMGGVGVEVVDKVLPQLKKDKQIDFVVAQAENVSDGKGLNIADYSKLKKIGVDAFSGGNWSLAKEEIFSALNDPNQPIVRPANYPVGTPGKDFKIIETSFGKVLIVSLLGNIVGKDADLKLDNPLHKIDEILDQTRDENCVATIVNFHGDFSSQKVIIGHYLDGRVSLCVGDHWHVPTADARVLPRSTAHISDVGMCGALDASLGITFDSVVPRWRDNVQTRNILADSGPRQFNAVLVQTDDNGLAKSIEQIQKVY